MKNIGEIFYFQPWAIREDILKVMSDCVSRHLQGQNLSSEEILSAIDFNKRRRPGSFGSVIEDAMIIKNGTAFIPINGIIAKRMSGIHEMSGGATTTSQIQEDIVNALANDDVKDIALIIDSPGGSVAGVAELSDFIFKARGQKPIVAFADGLMASAAFWIGSAADKIIGSVSSEVGSIGVFSVVHDMSVAAHNQGIKVEVIRSGKDKGIGQPGTVITEANKAVIQETVDDFFNLFVNAVARNRGITIEEVMPVATGKTFIGQKALDMGLIDEISTMEESFQSSAGSSNVKSETKTIVDISTEEGGPMDFKAITSEQLKKERPDLVKAFVSEGEAKAPQTVDNTAAIKEASDVAVKVERERVTGILGKTEVKEYKGMVSIAKASIESGESIEACESKMKDQRISDLKVASPRNPGAQVEVDGENPYAGMTHVEQANAEWDKENGVKGFIDKGSYIAIRKRELAEEDLKKK